MCRIPRTSADGRIAAATTVFSGVVSGCVAAIRGPARLFPQRHLGRYLGRFRVSVSLGESAGKGLSADLSTRRVCRFRQMAFSDAAKALS